MWNDQHKFIGKLETYTLPINFWHIFDQCFHIGMHIEHQTEITKNKNNNQ